MALDFDDKKSSPSLSGTCFHHQTSINSTLLSQAVGIRIFISNKHHFSVDMIKFTTVMVWYVLQLRKQRKGSDMYIDLSYRKPKASNADASVSATDLCLSA
jgi:hypothetical protein